MKAYLKTSFNDQVVGGRIFLSGVWLLHLEMSSSNCKNCGHYLDGNFCAQCGQAAQVHRINAAYFLHDIPHSILHVDKGLTYTFMQLLKRPGPALMEYLEGKRVNHFRPFGYVIILSAISSLVVHWNRRLIYHLYEQRTGQNITFAEGFFQKYQNAFIFLMIPIVSLCTWLVFRKNRYNFWEHMLMNTYLAAQLNILVIIIQLVSLIKFLITGSPQVNLTILITGFMTYYAFTFSRIMYVETKGFSLGLRLGLMCFLLASTYATGMSVVGIMSPWWH